MHENGISGAGYGVMGRSMPGFLLTGDYRIREKKFGTEGLRGPEPALDPTLSRLCSKIKSKIGTAARDNPCCR
jgi:hypothetical protein